VSEEGISVPMIMVGAAGAFALASLIRPRGASAATVPAPASGDAPPIIPVAAPIAIGAVAGGTGALQGAIGAPTYGLDFGRPVPSSVRAYVSSGWARPRGRGSKRRLHRGLDIVVPTGTPVLSIADGVVTSAHRQDTSDAGLWVAVKHPNSITSRYLHLSRVAVDVGQAVRRGDTIGLAGDTGNARGGVPHLHFDLRAPASMLPEIERLIGRPRSGWGPEMKPFGHSIPGEPWIPVDAYREIVRTDAAAMGIPLRDPNAPRNGSLTYRPVGDRGEPYPEWLRRIKGSSGVYVIRQRDADGDPVIVYVGESSAGRLYETLTRHFQDWRRWKGFWKDQFSEGHDPGLTYDRASVDVAIKVTPASRALDEEARLIRRLRPRDNLIGQPEMEDAPF